MPNKILHFDRPLVNPGGGQFSLLGLLKGLKGGEYQSTVLLPFHCSYEEMLKNYAIDYMVKPSKNWSAAIKELKPAIIHCNAATNKQSLWMAVLAKMHKIPFVWHVRVSFTAGWKDSVMAALSDRVVVISDTVGQKFKSRSEQAKIRKIYNPVDTEIFHPGYDQDEHYQEFSVAKDKQIVGVFSRLEPWKGHHLFLETAKLIKEQKPHVRFLIVGDGEEEYKQILFEEAKRLGLQDSIIWTGYREDIASLMCFCDVVIHPSIEPEPFGRTIIEVMACQTPIVSTNLGGPTESIEHGQDGYLAEPHPEAMADFTMRLLDHSDLRKDMGKKAIAKVEQGFTVAQHASNIQNVYKECLEV